MAGDGGELATVDAAFRSKYIDPRSGAASGYPENDDAAPYRIDIEGIMIWEYGTVSTRTDFRPADGHWIATAPRKS